MPGVLDPFQDIAKACHRDRKTFDGNCPRERYIPICPRPRPCRSWRIRDLPRRPVIRRMWRLGTGNARREAATNRRRISMSRTAKKRTAVGQRQRLFPLQHSQCERRSGSAQRWRSEIFRHDICRRIGRTLPSTSWWQSAAGWQRVNAVSRRRRGPKARVDRGCNPAILGHHSRRPTVTVRFCPPTLRGNAPPVVLGRDCPGVRCRGAPILAPSKLVLSRCFSRLRAPRLPR